MRSPGYFFKLVTACAKKSTCVKKNVGAILVKNELIISKGWNGVAGYPSCRAAQCRWCSINAPLGLGYDRCICTHAEQVAIGNAARRGIATLGSRMYVSLRPCTNCVKLALASGIKEMMFFETWAYDDLELEDRYLTLSQQFSEFRQIMRDIALFKNKAKRL
jgi:dCMP deaminase